MFRKLSLAVVFALGMLPFGVHALGLGDIHLDSALNQYFKADIDLLSVDQGEISDIRVQLASPGAFERAGVERLFLLSKLNFRPMVREDGRVVVRVTSRDPIREPFMNFLIEVNWPKGRLVREYTVLLDPPATLARKPAPVAQPRARTAAPRPAPEAPPSSRSVVSQEDVSWADSTGRQELEEMPSGFGGEYGPTRRNDTLWAIAKEVRHSGASMEQMMISLLRANPHAFINENINNLKVGQILRIPDRQEVDSISRRAASAAYREQVEQWQADRRPAESQVAGSAPAESAQPAATAGAPAESAAPAPQAELRIASARPEGEGEAGSGDSSDTQQVLDQLQQELIQAQEEKESALQEGAELRSRVDDLESQLEDLQRLLSLKSEQLSRLQAAVAQEEAAAEAQPETAEPAAVTPPATEEPETVTADTAAETQETTETAEAASEQATETQVEADTPPPVGAVTEAEPEVEPEPEPAPVVQQPAPKPKPAPSPKPKAAEPSFLDDLMEDTTLLGAGIAGVVVLLALLWVVISRRRSNSADFQESILISTIEDADSEQLDEQTLDPVSHPTEETSFLSDFSPSDIDALQDETGEVDPMAEADVYIAYGRYQQAEELIRQAIDKDPERNDLKYKLFEILFAIKDAAGFTAFAERSVEQGVNLADTDAWEKVISMGAQLDASHELFAAAAGSVDTDSKTVIATPEFAGEADQEGPALDDDLNLDELAAELDLPTDQEVDEDLASLDLDDLGEFSLDGEEGAGKADAEDDELDFDLDLGVADSGEMATFNLDEAAEEAASADEASGAEVTALDAAEGDEADLDLDLDQSEIMAELSDEPLEQPVEGEKLTIEDTLESADMEDLEFPAADESEEIEAEDLHETVMGLSGVENEEPDSSLSEESFEALGLDLAEDQGVKELDELEDSLTLENFDQEPEAPGPSVGEAESTDPSDEANTKLDLAKAYVDMGDADGARSILEEVLSEGNEGQQEEAKKLLETLT